MAAPFRILAEHYEACLRRFGDTARGVDWPDAAGAMTRYRVMAEVAREPGASILDFGCGAGHFLQYLRETSAHRPAYCGLDISPAFVELCRRKFPGVPFECLDVLAPGTDVPEADYIVMNGVFTVKREVPHAAFFEAMAAVLRKVFPAARKGIAFNLMSTQVDWERDDLFHVGFDDILHWVTRHLSRHYVVRADYGLYEYTVYVYKTPPVAA